MKTSKRYIVQPGKIHSLEDIRLEKMRLRLEILKTETNIHDGYRDILQALSLKNLASTVISDISSSAMLTKAFSFGKSLIEKRKKKKHDRKMEAIDHPPVESQ
jgi:hypothetical protein